VLAWANRQATYIIEDDFDAEHRFNVRTIPPLLSLDTRDRVIYIGNFARMYFPFLRLSFVIAPPALQPYLCAFKWLSDRGSGTLIQQAMARYIAQGDYARNLRRLGSLLVRRKRALVDALQRHLKGVIRFQANDGSGNLLLHFPALPAAHAEAFFAAALRFGVKLYSAAGYFMQPCAHVTVLLRYLGVEEPRLEEAVRRIARAYRTMLTDDAAANQLVSSGRA
jgi:GntR family transcriptional regulator / MocR family aminotransferase